MPREEDPKIIYLAPRCQYAPEYGEGRQWCEDDVWSGGQGECDIEGCSHVPTKYIIATT